MTAICKGFDNSDSLFGSGFKIAGEKYFTIRADDKAIQGRKVSNPSPSRHFPILPCYPTLPCLPSLPYPLSSILSSHSLSRNSPYNIPILIPFRAILIPGRRRHHRSPNKTSCHRSSLPRRPTSRRSHQSRPRPQRLPHQSRILEDPFPRYPPWKT